MSTLPAKQGVVAIIKAWNPSSGGGSRGAQRQEDDRTF